MEGSCIFDCYLYIDRRGYRVLKDDLERHRMSAPMVGDKEFAVTLKFAIFILHLMVVIVTVERKVEGIEPEAFAFLGITLCFFDLSYHSIIHL